MTRKKNVHKDNSWKRLHFKVLLLTGTLVLSTNVSAQSLPPENSLTSLYALITGIFIGIPLLIATITSSVSKSYKIRNFIFAFVITFTFIALMLFIFF